MINKEIVIEQTRALVFTDSLYYMELCADEIRKQRETLKKHIRKNPEFLYSFEPVDCKKTDSEIIRMMCDASYFAGVGPMAAVAGAIAQLARERITDAGANNCIINNGGDICFKTEKRIRLGLFAGENKRQNRLCIRVPKNREVSSCSSSSKMGHSLSFGRCDLATVIGKRGEICDALATAVANSIKSEKDLDPQLNFFIKRKGIYKVIGCVNNRIGFAGKTFSFETCDDPELLNKIVGYGRY